MASHKRQHLIPRSYLGSWIDPTAPEPQEYVWVIPKSGKLRRKSPDNLFVETDAYTIKGIEESRDLSLEHGLAQLEALFASVRKKIFSSEALNAEDLDVLAVFTAAMQARTRHQREHQRSQWGEALDMMRSMQAQFASASKEELAELARLSSTRSDSGEGMTISQVEELVKAPLQTTIAPLVQSMAPILRRMDLVIARTDHPQGFITSDDPCTLYDPELHKMPPFYRHVALMSPTTEAILPVGPGHLLVYNWRGQSSTLEVESKVVDYYNRLTWHHSGEVVSRSAEVNPYWMTTEELPSTARENLERDT
ncbi:MAG: DUF4238 domain-containing protein [Thioalkalivibrio sp.]|nr:DUF4238 domain-containing protein [Thioalkalivibrio sp.]